MKVGLSLGGGGLRGYAHIGAIQALNEAGIPIDIINGTSAGAVIGGAYALYADTDKIVAIAENIVGSVNINYFNIFRYSVDRIPFLRNWMVNAICDVSALRKSILTHRNNHKALRLLFGEHKFSDTQIPFSSVAVDLLAGKTVVIKQGKLIDGIIPSLSIPAIFPPIEKKRQMLVDGYVLANIPVRELREEGADFIIAITLGGEAETGYSNGFDITNLVEAVKYEKLNQWELDEADFHININIKRFDGMKFNNYEIAMRHGYRVTKRALPKLERRLAEANG
jgi:NTE family protein